MCLNKSIAYKAKVDTRRPADKDRGLMKKSRQGMMMAGKTVTAVDEKKWTDLRVSDLRGGNYRR